MADTIPIDRISTEGTQTRAALNDIVISEYAEAYEQGIELPPIDVYFDQALYWLADGFHRVKAAQQIGRHSIAANVHPGGQREAILHAVSSNETHGLRRTNADRRRAVLLMLNDPDWSAWANTEIARQCQVSEFLVRTIRGELTPAEAKPVKERTRQARRGTTTYPMKTENIGATKSRRKAADILKPDSVELQQSSTATPAAPVSSIESKIDHGTTDVQFPRESESSMTERSPSVIAPDEVLAVTPDVPPETLSTAEDQHEPDHAISDASAAGLITFDPHGSILPEAVLQVLTLDRRWDLATSAEQQEFVRDHRNELHRLLTRLERRAAASS